MTSEVYAADWVLPVVSPPIRAGAVVVDGDRVAWVGSLDELPERWQGVDARRRRGILTPGLVNAHTHLQYTGFDEVGTGAYDSFEDWSDAFGRVYDVVDPASWWPAALAGAREAVASGTTVFAEIVTDDEARGALGAVGAGGIEYLEAIGQFERAWAEGGRADYLAWLDAETAFRRGVSPHAAYSLDGSVIRELIEIARKRGLRLHSHLGESSVEAELYRHGDRRVLAAYGDLRDEFELVRTGGAGDTTGGYADSVGLLCETMHVAHAIYLDRDDRDLLLRRGTRVVLCPRSNAVIGLDEAPVAAYLREGHDIAVGTDSRASSPSLDLLADVRELHRIARSQGYGDADLSRRLVRAATLGGARAMGLDAGGYGVLAPGGPADLALFDVDVNGHDVEEALVLAGAGSCVLAVCAGAVLHGSA